MVPNTMPIIGTGGVVDGSDAFEHFLCGASAVQIGTVLVEEPRVWSRKLPTKAVRRVMRSLRYPWLVVAEKESLEKDLSILLLTNRQNVGTNEAGTYYNLNPTRQAVTTTVLEILGAKR